MRSPATSVSRERKDLVWNRGLHDSEPRSGRPAALRSGRLPAGAPAPHGGLPAGPRRRGPPPARRLPRGPAGGEQALAGHGPLAPLARRPGTLPLGARPAGNPWTAPDRRPGVRGPAVAGPALARPALRGAGRAGRRRLERVAGAGPRRPRTRTGIARRPAPLVGDGGRGRAGLRPGPADGGQRADPVAPGVRGRGRPCVAEFTYGLLQSVAVADAPGPPGGGRGASAP